MVKAVGDVSIFTSADNAETEIQKYLEIL